MTQNNNSIINNTNSNMNKDNENNFIPLFTSYQNDNLKDCIIENMMWQNSDGYRGNSSNNHLTSSCPMMFNSWCGGFDMDGDGKVLATKNNNIINSSVYNVFDEHKVVLKGISSVPIYDNIQHKKEIDSGFYFSKVAPEIIQLKLLKIVKNILLKNELKLDFETNFKNKYEFLGRIFTSSLSHFVINIYKLEKKDKQNNISIIKIRHVLGDNIGYCKFEDELLKKLQNEKIINDSCRSINDGISILDFELDSLKSQNNNEEMEKAYSNVSVENTNDDKEFDFNLCEIMLETLYNKNSCDVEKMHDASKLAYYLSQNDNRSKNMIDYILKNECKVIIVNLIEVIRSNNLFNAFIVLHILEIIKLLLSKENIKSKLIIPQSFTRDICHIYKKWSKSDGLDNNLDHIKIRFIKSQQIEMKCQSILQLIE